MPTETLKQISALRSRAEKSWLLVCMQPGCQEYAFEAVQDTTQAAFADEAYKEGWREINGFEYCPQCASDRKRVQ